LYKAPAIQRPRDVYDYHGHRLGETNGFHPDPGSGGLGIELEIDDEARELLDTETTRVWLSSDQVMAVRRDRMILDMSLRELRQRLRERRMWQDLDWAETEPLEP
jgi:hypothetical protein